MSKYTTVVIRVPEDAEGKKQVEQALNLLKPTKRPCHLRTK